MVELAVWISAGVAISAPAIGYLLRNHLIEPIQSDIADNEQLARRAMSKAEEVEDDHEQLKQYLVGSEIESDDGVLPRMQQSLERIDDKLDDVDRRMAQQSRAEVEKAFNVQKLNRLLEQLDDDDVDENPFDDEGGD